MNNRFLSRLTLIGIVMSSASSLIVVQMIHIQNSSKHQELSEKADEEYSYAIENYSPQRGNIYDRWAGSWPVTRTYMNWAPCWNMSPTPLSSPKH